LLRCRHSKLKGSKQQRPSGLRHELPRRLRQNELGKQERRRHVEQKRHGKLPLVERRRLEKPRPVDWRRLDWLRSRGQKMHVKQKLSA
jgi:hypothetical protein